ncbi:MAG: SGNH/GDSL hydrolase family protein [Phycisphaerae bacterium]
MSIRTLTRAVQCLAVVVAAAFPLAARAEFTPMKHGGDNSENRTGLWFCVEVGGPGRALPLPARMYATKESVTDGVALRVDVVKGNKGTIQYENDAWPAGTAGITMYAKASEPLELTVKGRAAFKVTTEWKKIDLTWEQLGTTPDKRDIGYQFAVGLAKPAEKDVWFIIDRLGTEGPAFEAEPKITPTAGPDETTSTKDLVGNAEVLAPTLARLKDKKPFKIVAFGDSVTAGAQAQRGNWALKPADLVPYLYFSDLARLLEERYGSNVTPVQKGYGGWTAAQGAKVMDAVFKEACADDVIILEFGANDIGGRGVDGWLADLKVLIEAAKKKTTQIIIMSPTTGGPVPRLSAQISEKFRAFAKAENVAWADITRWSMYRGEKYSWAYLANEYHPDAMGHLMIAEIMETLFGAPNFDWPPYAAKKTGDTPRTTAAGGGSRE